MELITIKTFDNAFDAEMMRAKLESEEIDCAIFDENLVSINWLYTNSIGGIKLKINKNDLDRVRQILSEIDSSLLTDENEAIRKCPKCNSTELYIGFSSFKGFFGILSAILTFLLTIFPIYFKSVYRCKKCGTEFK